jgi:hypothetical protein
VHEAMLVADLDARELAGTVVPKSTDLCYEIESAGGSCHACPDETEFCLKVYVQLEPAETDIEFQMNPDQSDCTDF